MLSKPFKILLAGLLMLFCTSSTAGSLYYAVYTYNETSSHLLKPYLKISGRPQLHGDSIIFNIIIQI